MILDFLAAFGLAILALILSLVVLGQEHFRLGRSDFLVSPPFLSCPDCQRPETTTAKTVIANPNPIVAEGVPVANSPTLLSQPTSLPIASSRISSDGNKMGAVAEISSRDSSQSIVNQAMELAKAGRADEAKAQLQSILQTNPNDEDALVALGLLLSQTFERPADARPYFERALEANPNNQFVLNELISLYVEENQLQDGLRYFEELSVRNSASISALQGRARILQQLGRDSDAIPLLKALADGPNSTTEIWHQLSHAYLKTGDFDSSLSIMDQMISHENTVQSGFSGIENDSGNSMKRIDILKLNKADILITRANRTSGDLKAAQKILDDVAASTGEDAQLSSLRRRLAETI